MGKGLLETGWVVVNHCDGCSGLQGADDKVQNFARTLRNSWPTSGVWESRGLDGAIGGHNESMMNDWLKEELTVCSPIFIKCSPQYSACFFYLL